MKHYELVPVLTTIFNYVSTGDLPVAWSEAISVIHKEGKDLTLCEGY